MRSSASVSQRGLCYDAFSRPLIGQGLSLLSVTSQGRKAEKDQSEASISNCRRDKEQLAASAGRQRARVLFYLEMRAPSPSKSEERERLPDMALWSQIIVLAFPNQIIADDALCY